MKKILLMAGILFFISCNNAGDSGKNTNATDSLTNKPDSIGSADPNMNRMNNMTTDSGYKNGGSHTN